MNYEQKDFIDKLDNLFDIAHANAIDLIKIQEDIDFSQFQRIKVVLAV